MKIISDDQAYVLINLHAHVGFYVHTSSEAELILAERLSEACNVKSSLELYELPKANILAPQQTLFAFTRFPRLLLYRRASNILDLTGFKAISTWISDQY